MPEIMSQADLAITAGGTTLWELAFMGVPILAIILSKDQQLSVERLHSCKAGINAGWYSDLDHETLSTLISSLLGDWCWRAELSQCAQNLVDGQGANRVVAAIRLLSKISR